ncbi:LacI family DNA-binding transcriptional regulator [Carnobacterium viridans]|uniref:Transcriptional regulator, LacI family n=1 Tax=Carnobacterium viridans TaxID=174587 RepID=A0A1H0XID7_9LACT|nr:LacI family DNA-binding transcriptional regulator [Carnobacterium viridans]SDQ02509.1 transcriptional regulator, LacI family [Carnobacterium viridans]SDQ02549.1 transcriptional regulator, LacI family [Carnobacterium viridans]
MENVSIKDIAKLSGVSVATVSRVINNNGRFSEETGKKVRDIIESTGYRTNRIAKSLRTQKTQSIGIVVPDITNFFFSNVVQKIEKHFFDIGYSTIICNTDRDPKKEKTYLKMLESKMVDGLVIISGVKKFEPTDIGISLIPIVYIDREPNDSVNSIFISSDHYQAAYTATSHLIRQGCKHPVLLLYDRASSSSEKRLSGFLDALKENHIFSSLEENIFTFPSSFDFVNLDKEDESFRNFLTKEQKIDGIFAVNDLLGVYALDVLRKEGKKVPADVKIIGFDNTPYSRFTTPKLSSIEQNIQEIATLACDSLKQLMENNYIKTEAKRLVPVKLIIRESSQTNK